MRDPQVRRQRREMLHQAHIAPLTGFVERLRLRNDADYPYFDPFDGGIRASLLFLFEKPGLMTAANSNPRASGFISRDNDDRSAEATFHFMEQAGIPRSETITWNVIPGWNGTQHSTTAELRRGMNDFERLLPLLPKLKGIVLVGRKAAKAQYLINRLPVFVSDHPSPRVRARYPERWHRIPEVWAEAARLASAAQPRL